MIDPRRLREDQALVQLLIIPGGLTSKRPAYCECIVDISELSELSAKELSERYLEPLGASAVSFFKDEQ